MADDRPPASGFWLALADNAAVAPGRAGRTPRFER